jgi:hypothetical protein
MGAPESKSKAGAVALVNDFILTANLNIKQTVHVEKWHILKDPKNAGYDTNIGGCEWGHPVRGYFSPDDIPGYEDGPERRIISKRSLDHSRFFRFFQSLARRKRKTTHGRKGHAHWHHPAG